MSQPTAIAKEKTVLRVSDGTEMAAYLARPKGAGPHPGIIVLQEAFGVNSHIRSVAERLAQQGYVAIAPELFHRTAPGFEGDYKNFPAVLPHARAVTIAGAEADLQAALAWLKARSDVKPGEFFSLGFCMGGRISFVANAVLPLRAAASFYGGGIAPDLLGRAAELHAPMLLFWGGLDKHILPEHRRAVADALTAANKPYVNVEFSSADHGFFCDERASYQPQAAREAWTLLLQFLQDNASGS